MTSSALVAVPIGGKSYATADGWVIRPDPNGLWVGIAPEDKAMPPLYAPTMKSLVWLINGWSSVARIGQATRRDADRARRQAKEIEQRMTAEARRQALIEAGAGEPVSSRGQRALQRRRERLAGTAAAC